MKPKPTVPRNAILWGVVGLLVISGIIALISAFSGGEKNSESDVNAVYTSAAATVAAQQLTLQAAAPSATPTVITQTPTITFTPLALPSLAATQAGSSNPSSGGASGAVGCNNSIFITDVTVPDNTVLTPGQTFTKTWRLQNTGSCPWTTSYKVSFVSGNAMGGAATALAATVQPGQTGDISVAMTAPTAAGDAKGTWILTNDSGQNFGSTFYVLVKVGATTSTTGTATATGLATATATATTGVTAPAAATGLAITLTCTQGGSGTQYQYIGTLTWVDNSTNETGFNIYINGAFAASVAANITSYALPSGVYYDPQTPTFAVEAFNNGGKAAQATTSPTCP